MAILTTSKKLGSIFNHTLVCLLILHSLYLVSVLANEVYNLFGQSSYTAHMFYAYFLLAFKVYSTVRAV